VSRRRRRHRGRWAVGRGGGAGDVRKEKQVEEEVTDGVQRLARGRKANRSQASCGGRMRG
jgi:hypothetical protein